MRKVILNLAVSLDGFIEGPGGEVDWCIMEDDMDFGAFLDCVDTVLYGRVSYDAWGNYQPGDDAPEAEKSMWRHLHAMDKYVFSHTERKDTGATFITSGIPEAIRALRQQDGKDIWLYGGASLISTFIRLDLVDVYTISVHPVALGKGKPLFEALDHRLQLRCTGTRTFRSGVVELTYEPQNRS